NPTQIAELNRIQAFKDMGFALGEIADLLRQPLSASQLRQVLEERRKTLQARVSEDVGRLERIEARLRSLESLAESDPLVLFGRTRERWVASTREKLKSYDEADALLAHLARRVDPRMLTEAAPPSGTHASKATAASTAKRSAFSNGLSLRRAA